MSKKKKQKISQDETLVMAETTASEVLTLPSVDPEIEAAPVNEEAAENAVEEKELIELAEKEGLMDMASEDASDESDTDEDSEELSLEEQDFICSGIEAVLFMSDKPVSISKLRQIINSDVTNKQFKFCMNRIRAEFEKSFRGTEICFVAGGYQLRTKPLMSVILRKMVKTQPLKLTTTSLETMAVIAYKQPITKDEIDRLRGVDSGYMLRNLMEKRLVKIIGRSELPGRPMLYGSTHEFLELFNLANLEALPSLHEIESMVAESEVGEDEEEQKRFHAFNEIVEHDATVLFEEGGLDTQVEELRKQIAEIPTSTSFIEDQKQKEKILQKLSARNLSDEDKLELEAELARIERHFEMIQNTVKETQAEQAASDEIQPIEIIEGHHGAPLIIKDVEV